MTKVRNKIKKYETSVRKIIRGSYCCSQLRKAARLEVRFIIIIILIFSDVSNYNVIRVFSLLMPFSRSAGSNAIPVLYCHDFTTIMCPYRGAKWLLSPRVKIRLFLVEIRHEIQPENFNCFVESTAISCCLATSRVITQDVLP